MFLVTTRTHYDTDQKVEFRTSKKVQF